MNIPGKRQVVLGHEVEGIGVDDGEYLCGKFIDAIRLEVGIERQ